MITFLRVAASFAIVGVLLWLFMRAGSGRLGALISGAGNGRNGDPLAVLGRRQLSKNAGIALVRAGERTLLVGVSDGGVQLLAEGDDLLDDASDATLVLGRATTGQVAVVHQNDVVSDRALSPLAIAEHPSATDLPNARTRLGRAHRPRSPRMSFVSALREMTVRRS